MWLLRNTISRFSLLRLSHSSRATNDCLKRKFSVPPLQTPESTTVAGDVNAHTKVYEIRTYNVKPKYFKQFIEMTEENLHLRLKHSKLFGFWTTELGGMNEVIHIWEFDSHDHRTEVRKAVTNDPVWMEEFISKVSLMWNKQDNVTVELLPWSNLALPASKGVYELDVYHMSSHMDIWDGRLKATVELMAKKMHESNSVLIGVFQSLYGPHNTVYALWQHDSFDKLQLKKDSLRSETSKSVLHAFYHEVLTGYSKGLKPIKISPLQ